MKVDPQNFIVTDECEPPKTSKNAWFDDDTLAALRSRLSDYLAARGVELRENGTRLVGLCPMHQDHTPSFAVFGTHHETCGCHPCGFTGDVFAVSQWMGLSSSFPEAVQEVVSALGVYLPETPQDAGTRFMKAAPPRASKEAKTPFVLSNADLGKLHEARLAFCNAVHGDDPIIDRITNSLGLGRESLRLVSWGSSGLGLANGWLCYAYPQGLKWRNPDPHAKARFVWLLGKATMPWRWEWACRPEARTIYLTEGESDCMAMIASGLESGGDAACVACPGTSFPRVWASLFRGKRVVICFDLDQPGRIATAKAAAILKGHAEEILTWKGPKCHE